MITKDKWVWMGHAGHLIIANYCRFHLNTAIGDYIVSTVGEYVPPVPVMEIFNEMRKLGIPPDVKGDMFELEFIKRNGYEEIGANRKYETMVFKSKKGEYECCPFEIDSGGSDVEMDGYNTAEDAMKGHYELCEKYASIQ